MSVCVYANIVYACIIDMYKEGQRAFVPLWKHVGKDSCLLHFFSFFSNPLAAFNVKAILLCFRIFILQQGLKPLVLIR